MKTAQIFREKASDKILIFISSSREYVFEAYDVEAFQYLLKPVDDRKLKSVLQKAVHKTEIRSQEFIIVSRERQKKKLFLDDIYYFEIKGRIVDVHGPDGIFTYYEQIGELENKLQENGVANGDTTKRSEVFRAYQLSIKEDDRLKGTWSLQQYEK